MKKIIFIAFSAISCLFYAQNVGINTVTPHPSSILDISASAPPNTSSTTKKGLLPPRISLASITQQLGASPNAVGLMIYNLTDGGTFPDNFVANRFYFWNGSRWMGLPVQGYVDEATKPQVFYIQGTDTQTILKADINMDTAPTNENTKRVQVTFSGSPVVNIGNVVTFEDAADTFAIDF